MYDREHNKSKNGLFEKHKLHLSARLIKGRNIHHTERERGNNIRNKKKDIAKEMTHFKIRYLKHVMLINCKFR